MQIPEANLRNMLNAISKGNHVLNETVQFVTNQKTECPDCDLDPIRMESTDSNCETCEGSGYTMLTVAQEIPASVELEDDFINDFTKAGKLQKGQIFMTIDIAEITNVLNVSNSYDLNDYKQMRAFIWQYDYVVWKGARYKVESFEPGWLQGILYEIGLVMNLYE